MFKGWRSNDFLRGEGGGWLECSIDTRKKTRFERRKECHNFLKKSSKRYENEGRIIFWVKNKGNFFGTGSKIKNGHFRAFNWKGGKFGKFFNQSKILPQPCLTLSNLFSLRSTFQLLFPLKAIHKEPTKPKYCSIHNNWSCIVVFVSTSEPP